MVPQPTAQYGHTVRYSVALRILSWRTAAWAGRKSNPRALMPTAPPAAALRKVRRDIAVSAMSTTA